MKNRSLYIKTKTLTCEPVGDGEFAVRLAGRDHKPWILDHSDLYFLSRLKYRLRGQSHPRFARDPSPDVLDLAYRAQLFRPGDTLFVGKAHKLFDARLAGSTLAAPNGVDIGQLKTQALANGTFGYSTPPETSCTVDYLPSKKDYVYGVVRGDSEETVRRIEQFVQENRTLPAADIRKLYKEVLIKKGPDHTHTIALKKLAEAKPCKIPHVRMVRAAALQPGMVIVFEVLRGKVTVKFDVASVTPNANDIFVKGTRLHFLGETDVCTRYGTMALTRVYHADQVLPVFVEWRDKVAL